MNFVLSEIELPVRLRTASVMDDDALLRFCADNDSLRVEREPNGELLIMSPSGFDSSRMNVSVCRALAEWAELDDRGFATDSSGGYTLPDGSMRAPDAAWVAKDRVARLSEAEQAKFAPLCPDFVIELRSPSDRLGELQAKMAMWIENGAAVAWLIDPQRKVVEIYRPSDAAEVYENPSSVQGSGPVRGFELVMARVWG